MKIALDADGVLCDFTSAMLRVVEEVTGRRYSVADVNQWDFARALGLSANENRAVREIIGTRRGFCAQLAPYPFARQGVRRLRALGEVFCVTSPWDESPWWQSEREAWLALHFGIDRVHHAADKSGFEADVFVDDKASHVRAWSRRWPGRIAVFWRGPHNSADPLPAGAHSLASWDALYEVAREFAAQRVPEAVSP